MRTEYVVLAAVPPAHHGHETTPDDGHHGTSLDNHMCVFRMKFEVIFEPVLLLYLE